MECCDQLHGHSPDKNCVTGPALREDHRVYKAIVLTSHFGCRNCAGTALDGRAIDDRAEPYDRRSSEPVRATGARLTMKGQLRSEVALVGAESDWSILCTYSNSSRCDEEALQYEVSFQGSYPGHRTGQYCT